MTFLRLMTGLLLVLCALGARGGCTSPVPTLGTGGDEMRGQQTPSGAPGAGGVAREDGATGEPGAGTLGVPGVGTPSRETGVLGEPGIPGADGTDDATGEHGTAQPFPGASAESELERLERELERSLGTFDETMRGEQGAIAEVAHADAASAANASGAAAQANARASAAAGEQGATSQGPQQSPNVGGTKLPDDMPPGDGGDTVAPPSAPADVGDGRDDDVVARNLREAALAEDDPVLRERLWEEYRRYKRSIR